MQHEDRRGRGSQMATPRDPIPESAWVRENDRGMRRANEAVTAFVSLLFAVALVLGVACGRKAAGDPVAGTPGPLLVLPGGAIRPDGPAALRIDNTGHLFVSEREIPLSPGERAALVRALWP